MKSLILSTLLTAISFSAQAQNYEESLNSDLQCLEVIAEANNVTAPIFIKFQFIVNPLWDNSTLFKYESGQVYLTKYSGKTLKKEVPLLKEEAHTNAPVHHEQIKHVVGQIAFHLNNTYSKLDIPECEGMINAASKLNQNQKFKEAYTVVESSQD